MNVATISGATRRQPLPEPAVSVILPLYNAERYLRAALESILAQTFRDFELLAVDDGSSDGSLALLQEFANRDDRIRVVARENRGLVQTLNEMIPLARGKLLARMDADDLCFPQRFELQVAYLNEHPECVAVGTRCLLIDPEGLPLGQSVNDLEHDDIDKATLAGWAAIRGMCHPTVMMRKDAVVRIGGYSTEFTHAEDVDLFLRLAEIGKLANIGDVLFKYRQHFGSVGHSYTQRQAQAAAKAIRAAGRRRNIEVDTNALATAVSPASKGDVHHKWAWWALYSGFKRSARKHAMSGFLKKPFKLESFKVLACAIRGY